MECSRSLPKVLLLDDDQVMIFGGQFFDNPEIKFAELINHSQLPLHEDIDGYYLPEQLEKMHHQVGGPDFLGMFTIIQHWAQPQLDYY